ncbi:gamma-glutamyltranspeptidase [Thalassospira marina]|uniref:Gamma-glutamyltranspeptidase n=2 Tax=Thalassospira marina TaxID=2048283 RepID=A0A2N3KYK3_9PROT|nr:gamma-glutamyltranspeptidase [Thalassospira marina]
MRLSKICVPYVRSSGPGEKSSGQPSWRIAAAFAMTAILAACTTPTQNLGQIGAVKGVLGGVTGDEPLAVQTARDVLSAGGTAADAAVAMYATMTVTKPSVAGIGGGGVCVVHDRLAKKIEVLDFWPRPGTQTKSGQVHTAVPGVPRGLYALSARYGRLNWGQLLASAEQDARFGTPLSRSLKMDLDASRDKILSTPSLAQIYSRDGELLDVGDRVQQLGLGALLTSLRVKGPGEFYNGGLATQLVAAVNNAGGTLTLADLNNYKPVWREATAVTSGNENIYFTHAPRAAAGTGDITGEGELVDVLNRYLADIDNAPTSAAKGGRSGFVVVDVAANAVACETTMTEPFGVGIGANAFGLDLASGDVAEPLVGPVLKINPNVFEFYYGIAGTDTPAGATSQIAQMAEELVGAGSAANIGLNSKGVSTVNKVSCPAGIPPHPESCQFVADPAGAGMALGR